MWSGKTWQVECKGAGPREEDNKLLRNGLLWSEHGGGAQGSQDLVLLTQRGAEFYKVRNSNKHCLRVAACYHIASSSTTKSFSLCVSIFLATLDVVFNTRGTFTHFNMPPTLSHQPQSKPPHLKHNQQGVVKARAVQAEPDPALPNSHVVVRGREAAAAPRHGA